MAQGLKVLFRLAQMKLGKPCHPVLIAGSRITHGSSAEGWSLAEQHRQDSQSYAVQVSPSYLPEPLQNTASPHPI